MSRKGHTLRVALPGLLMTLKQCVLGVLFVTRNYYFYTMYNNGAPMESACGKAVWRLAEKIGIFAEYCMRD